MATETIVDAMEQHLADVLPQDAGKEQRRRVAGAYMAGALEVLRRLDAAQRAEAIRAEVLGWARGIGREVSR